MFPMAQFQILDDLMKISGSSKLHDCMRVWFVQQSHEDSFCAKLIHACCEHLRRVMAKNRVMIADMEALGHRGLALDSLDALKKTQERHRALLELLVDLCAQAKAGVREEEGNAMKMNDFN